MKSIIKILFMVALVLSINACKDYLNLEPLLDKQLNRHDVFINLDYSKQWLAGVYSHLREHDNWDVCTKEQNSNQFDFISDDMYYTDREKVGDMVFGQLASYRIYRAGKYTEQFLQDQWSECYNGIRDASIYIQNIDLLTEGDNIRQGMDAAQLAEYIKQTKAEARFLRSYYYWQLLRKYGPIPILPDEGVDFTASYEDLSYPRCRYDSCVNYITSELALAACDLPLDRNSNEILKPTKGAALTARAKVYLFGASPQYNGNTNDYAKQLVNYDGSPLIDPEYKEVRWAQAAAAAKEVMNLNKYHLYSVSKRDADNVNMSGVTGSALTYTYYNQPKTIEPGGTIVSDGNNGWKIQAQSFPGYSDQPFNNGNGQCGWADIDPCESYRQLFDGTLTAYANPELIFSRGYGDQMNNLSLHQMPRSLGGWNCHGLTMKMYDAYYMADGTDFYRYKEGLDNEGRKYFYSDPSADMPGYVWNPNNPEGSRAVCTGISPFTMPSNFTYYTKWKPLPQGVSLQNANREPRFYASVAYNGSIWENLGANGSADNKVYFMQRFLYRNSDDGESASGFYYWTGIGIRKYYNKYDWQVARVNKAEPAMRYAEVLLTYAEALNELNDGATYNIPAYDGTGTITVSRSKEEISRGLRPVRVRAGLKDFTDDYFGDKEEMRMRIKREWQIEFMGESHRYYDLRRWKDAEREEAMPVFGFNMDMTDQQKDFWLTPHEITIIPAIFAEKMYLWPISQDELKKNRKLTQNPGWKTFDQ
jgi:hypothetical protein